MASESNTYQIKAADKCEALDVSAGGASAEQIKGWLNDTNAPAIVRAADAYASAASMVGLARESLLSAAKALSEMWGGPTAALFQAGLHKLDTTGDELATKMKRVSDQLNAYGAVHLPEAIRKVDAATAPATPQPSAGPKPTVTTTPTAPPSSSAPTTAPSTTPAPGPTTPPAPGADPNAAAKEKQNEQARRILEDLNMEIAGLYSLLPTDVSYDLEIPSPPSADGGYQQTNYSSPDRYQSSFRGGNPGGSPTFDTSNTWPGTGGADRPGTGGPGQGPGGPGQGPGTGSGGGGSDGSTPTNPDKPGGAPGGDTPPGTDPNAPGTDPNAPGGNGETGAGSGGSTGDGRGDDGTAPAVIGQNDSSRQTETASYVPTTPPSTTMPTSTPYGQIPTTMTPTISTTPGMPNTFVGPTSSSPGVPSVIGGGTLGGPNAMTSAAARGGLGGGMPFMPMGGMGGTIGGGESEENTYSTDLREDRDPWNTSHEVTTDLIGRTAEA
ncbi:hypothetical protein [Nonomuraea dietziae]|uniref:hypothetical protein n=1 Tax=Nonomuraea dietziae TaxID=65515 RepID=UPI00341BB743